MTISKANAGGVDISAFFTDGRFSAPRPRYPDTVRANDAARARRLAWLAAVLTVLAIALAAGSLSRAKTGPLFAAANTASAVSTSPWSGIVDIIAGDGFTVGLRRDGTVVYAGDDFAGAGRRIASWDNIRRIEYIRGDNYIVGYKYDGSIRVESLLDRDGYSRWVDEDFASWSDIDKVCIGLDFCLGLKTDGTIVTIIDNAEIQAAIRPVSSWQGIKQVATDGFEQVVGLKADGTIVCTDPDSLYGWVPWNDPSNWNNVRELVDSGGVAGIFGIKNDGTVLGMDAPGWTNIASLYFDSEVMYGLRWDGTVATGFAEYTYDDPSFIEISNWENIVALVFDVTGRFRFFPVGLCSDGTVRAICSISDYGDANTSPYGEWDFTGWSHVTKLYSGTAYTIGLCSDGSVLVTGGEFGTIDYLEEISHWTDIVAIYASHEDFDGRSHIVGLKRDGTVVAAGDNTRGQCNIR